MPFQQRVQEESPRAALFSVQGTQVADQFAKNNRRSIVERGKEVALDAIRRPLREVRKNAARGVEVSLISGCLGGHGLLPKLPGCFAFALPQHPATRVGPAPQVELGDVVVPPGRGVRGHRGSELREARASRNAVVALFVRPSCAVGRFWCKDVPVEVGHEAHPLRPRVHLRKDGRPMPHLRQAFGVRELRSSRCPWRLGDRSLKAARTVRHRSSPQPLAGVHLVQSEQAGPLNAFRPCRVRTHTSPDVARKAGCSA